MRISILTLLIGIFCLFNILSVNAFYISKEGNYTGKNYYVRDTVTDVVGIGIDGNNFYLAELLYDHVYKFDRNFTYTGESFSVENEMGTGVTIYGLTTDGEYIWGAYQAEQTIYQYYMNGTYTGMSWEAVNCMNPMGMTSNGTSFFIADWQYTNNHKVHEYSFSHNASEVKYIRTFDLGDRVGFVIGITYYGGYLFVNDQFNPADSGIFKFDTNGNYIRDYPKYYEGIGDYRGMITNGTYFWINEKNTGKMFEFYGILAPNISMDLNRPSNNSIIQSLNVNLTANISCSFGCKNATLSVYNQSNDLVKSIFFELEGYNDAELIAIINTSEIGGNGIYTWDYLGVSIEELHGLTERNTFIVNITIEEEPQKPIELTYASTSIYQQMASAGAGLGIFTNNIAIPLMNFLLIEFLVVLIVVIVCISLAHSLKHYIVHLSES